MLEFPLPHNCQYLAQQSSPVFLSSKWHCVHPVCLLQMEALKKFAPRKALGPFDPNMGLPLPTNNYNSAKQVVQASENGTIMASNVYNRTSPPSTSIQLEASQAWVPMEGSVAPLDLSLKMLARFNSQDSLHW